MKQVTISTKRVEDGLVELSVPYDPSVVLLRTIRDAGRSLTQTKGSLFMSVYPKTLTEKQWLFIATMNPNGTAPTTIQNIALYRTWAERLTGAICCIDMEGFNEKTTRKSPLPGKAKKRPRSM